MTYRRYPVGVFICIASIIVICLLMVPCVGAQEWPGFRGPTGAGLSSDKNLPIKWSKTNNIVWKKKLPGPGASSPVIWGERVFLTCWSGYADKPNSDDMKKLQRHLLCLDRKTGKRLWKKDVPAKLPETMWGRPIGQHGYATHTPVTDGKRVYAFFGKTGVLAYDFKGKEIWRTDVGKYVNHFGSGGSPVLWRNLVIVNAVIEGGRLVALNKDTGKIVWRVRIYDDCWTTPLLVKTPKGKHELILMTPGTLFSYDPDNGKQIWECDCPEPDYVSANPVYRDGIVYVMGSGNLGKVFMAVKVGGRGKVTKTHVLWKNKRTGISLCSPILVGSHLYFFSSLGYCLKAKDGTVVFRERLPGLGREYASPVSANGNIYVFTRSGAGLVLAAGAKMKLLARNDLGDPDGFVASPAIHGGRIYVRSNSFIYCLGNKVKSR